MENLVIKNLKSASTKEVPIWLMRQAGRYMEEYRNIRSKFPDFINMCKIWLGPGPSGPFICFLGPSRSIHWAHLFCLWCYTNLS